MSELTIRKAANGFIIQHISETLAGYNPKSMVFLTGEAMLAYVTQALVDPCVGVPVESPAEEEVEGAVIVDTSSLGPLKTAEEFIEGTPAPLPVEPLTDLTGVDYAPAFEGYQPNGSLPETE